MLADRLPSLAVTLHDSTEVETTLPKSNNFTGTLKQCSSTFQSAVKLWTSSDYEARMRHQEAVDFSEAGVQMSSQPLQLLVLVVCDLIQHSSITTAP